MVPGPLPWMMDGLVRGSVIRNLFISFTRSEHIAELINSLNGHELNGLIVCCFALNLQFLLQPIKKKNLKDNEVVFYFIPSHKLLFIF